MKRRGLGKGQGMGYKNLVPRDSYIHKLNALGVKTRLQNVINFTKSSVIPDYEIRTLEEKAIYQKFKEEDNTYVTKDMIKKSEDESLDQAYKRIKKDLLQDFGSIDKYNLYKDWFYSYRGYSWVRLDEVKKGRIIGQSGFSVTLPLDAFYNFTHNLLKGEHLDDLSKVHSFTDNQKQQYYTENGEVSTDLFYFKRYKNGKVEIEFVKESDAEKVFDAFKDYEREYNSNRQKYDRWVKY